MTSIASYVYVVTQR